MFLYERSVEPRYGFYILNRLSLDNLQVPILQELQIQQSGDYLMYKLADGRKIVILTLQDDRVHGLWIFGQEDMKRLSHQLTEYE